MENVVLLSTTSEKPKIRKNEIQYFIVQHFPFFRQKLSVVLNCTPRSEIGRRSSKAVSGLARRYECDTLAAGGLDSSILSFWANQTPKLAYL